MTDRKQPPPTEIQEEVFRKGSESIYQSGMGRYSGALRRSQILGLVALVLGVILLLIFRLTLVGKYYVSMFPFVFAACLIIVGLALLLRSIWLAYVVVIGLPVGYTALVAASKAQQGSMILFVTVPVLVSGLFFTIIIHAVVTLFSSRK